MADIDPGYIVDNRRHAERILSVLADRRLFTERANLEDAEFCRRSAQELRGLLEALSLNIEAGGFLVEMLDEMRGACRHFVTAAGRDAVNFRNDLRLFNIHLQTLRITVGQRVTRIVNEFDIVPVPEIQQLMGYQP